MSSASRTSERNQHSTDTRVFLLEKDADEIESDVLDLKSRLDQMLRILIGILVSTTTAAILLALNLAVQT